MTGLCSIRNKAQFPPLTTERGLGGEVIHQIRSSADSCSLNASAIPLSIRLRPVSDSVSFAFESFNPVDSLCF